MKKRVHKPRQAGTQKQKFRLTLVLIATGGFSFLIAAGIFMYINLSQSEKSNAQKTSAQLYDLPTDFNCPELLIKQTDMRMNGIRVKKYIDPQN